MEYYIYIYTCIYTLYMCMCGAALLTTVCCPFISSIAVPEGLGGRRGGTWEKGEGRSVVGVVKPGTLFHKIYI